MNVTPNLHLYTRSTVNIHAVVANYHAQHTSSTVASILSEQKAHDFLGVDELARIREIRFVSCCNTGDGYLGRH